VTDLDSLLLAMVAEFETRATGSEANVRVLARDDLVAQTVAGIVESAGAATLALTLPEDIDEALGLIENLLPGADLVVIAADPTAPIREALEVIATLHATTGAMQPGGDTAWGLVGHAALVLLPGDEFEAAVAAHVVAVPATRALSGVSPHFASVRPVTVDAAVETRGKARTFVPGRVSVADSAAVSPLPFVRSLAAADVLLIVPEGAAVVAGDRLAALSLHGAW